MSAAQDPNTELDSYLSLMSDNKITIPIDTKNPESNYTAIGGTGKIVCWGEQMPNPATTYNATGADIGSRLANITTIQNSFN